MSGALSATHKFRWVPKAQTRKAGVPGKGARPRSLEVPGRARSAGDSTKASGGSLSPRSGEETAKRVSPGSGFSRCGRRIPRFGACPSRKGKSGTPRSSKGIPRSSGRVDPRVAGVDETRVNERVFHS